MGEVSVPARVFEDAYAATRKQLEAAREGVGASGVVVHTHFEEAPVSPAIAQLATRLECDLVVMGTRGVSGLRHVVLGSVAERTLRLAPCPVLTVK